MEGADTANRFQRMNSTSSVVSSLPHKDATIFQVWSRWTLFQQVALISLIIANFAIWIILLSEVSSNRTKLSEILDSL
jgi:hypothetical protein